MSSSDGDHGGSNPSLGATGSSITERGLHQVEMSVRVRPRYQSEALCIGIGDEALNLEAVGSNPTLGTKTKLLL